MYFSDNVSAWTRFKAVSTLRACFRIKLPSMLFHTCITFHLPQDFSVFMDRPKASIVFASQQHCKSCISDPSQVKLSLAISTAAAVGFTHKCFVVSEWVHAAAWALTNTRLQVSSLVYSVLY